VELREISEALEELDELEKEEARPYLPLSIVMDEAWEGCTDLNDTIERLSEVVNSLLPAELKIEKIKNILG
jgi:hypothetical protein